MEKTIPCRWFMGCNSQNGFYSLFEQFTRPEEGWRCILIKGGPGTGKSTLMNRVIKLAALQGQLYYPDEAGNKAGPAARPA